LSLTHASDRGVKHARFELLRTAPCPAALVECGFISNRGEERKLGDSDYRDSIAEGIARGILTYISKADGGS
jgi:N-acetylmuramoyl-L-alanine amidase